MAMEEKVIQFLIAVLRDRGSMHYNHLADCMSAASYNIKDYFSNHDDSDKHWFFKHNSNHFIVENSGYVSVQLNYHAQSTGFSKKSGTVEETVVDLLVDILRKEGQMHFNHLIEDLESPSSHVKHFFNNKDDSDRHWFFRNHSDKFIVENSGYVSGISGHESTCLQKSTNRTDANFSSERRPKSDTLSTSNKSPCRVNPKSSEEIVVKFLVSALKKNGSMHFNSLIKLLISSSTDTKHFFNDYNDSNKYWFFKNHSEDFLVENDGYISLSAKGNQKKSPEKTKSLTSEEKVIIFLVSVLKNQGTLHCTRLVGNLQEASADIKNYFANQDKSDIHWFFKNHSENFIVENSGYVSLSSDDNEKRVTEGVIKRLNTVIDRDMSLSPVRPQSSGSAFAQRKALEGKVCDFLLAVLKYNGPMHFSKAIAAMPSSTADISQFFQGYGNSDLLNFFKKRTKDFHVENSGYVSVMEKLNVLPIEPKTKEEKVVEFLVQILTGEESLHCNHLIDKMSSGPYSIRNFFDGKDDSDKFWFFRNHSGTFFIKNDGYVTLLTRNSEMLINKRIDVRSQSLEQQVVDFLFSVLQVQGGMYSNQLIKNMSSAPPDIGAFFDTFSGSEKHLFFKNRSDYFVTQNSGYVSAANRNSEHGKQGCSSQGTDSSGGTTTPADADDSVSSEFSRTTEQRAKDFLDILLLVRGPMHYKQLIKDVLEYPHDFCQYFKTFQDKDKYIFFQRFPQDFIIGPNGFVKGRSWNQ